MMSLARSILWPFGELAGLGCRCGLLVTQAVSPTIRFVLVGNSDTCALGAEGPANFRGAGDSGIKLSKTSVRQAGHLRERHSVP